MEIKHNVYDYPPENLVHTLTAFGLLSQIPGTDPYEGQQVNLIFDLSVEAYLRLRDLLQVILRSHDLPSEVLVNQIGAFGYRTKFGTLIRENIAAKILSDDIAAQYSKGSSFSGRLDREMLSGLERRAVSPLSEPKIPKRFKLRQRWKVKNGYWWRQFDCIEYFTDFSGLPRLMLRDELSSSDHNIILEKSISTAIENMPHIRNVYMPSASIDQTLDCVYFAMNYAWSTVCNLSRYGYLTPMQVSTEVELAPEEDFFGVRLLPGFLMGKMDNDPYISGFCHGMAVQIPEESLSSAQTGMVPVNPRKIIRDRLLRKPDYSKDYLPERYS